jgi:hypothetical protein
MPLWMCVLVGVLSAVLDWSGVGPNALRDRIAAIGYLAAALGWFDIIGLSAWETRMHAATDHNTRVIWSMASVVPVFFWFGAMSPQIGFLGKFAQLSFRNNRRTTRTNTSRASGTSNASNASNASNTTTTANKQEHINSWLLMWTIGVALSIPLAMPSQYHNVVVTMSNTVTNIASSVGSSIGAYFGWN